MKDKTVIIIISAAVFILLASVVIGIVMMGRFMKSVVAERPKMQPMPGMGSPMGSGSTEVPGMPPMVSMMPGKDDTFLPPRFLLEDPNIKLSKEQSKIIDAIYKNNESAINPFMRKIDTESIKFRKALVSPKANIKSIQKEKSIITNIKNKIDSINIESWIKLRSALKPNQLLEFEKTLNSFFIKTPGMPGLMMPGGPGMMPPGGPGMPPGSPGMMPSPGAQPGRPGMMPPQGMPHGEPGMPPQGPPPNQQPMHERPY